MGNHCNNFFDESRLKNSNSYVLGVEFMRCNSCNKSLNIAQFQISH